MSAGCTCSCHDKSAELTPLWKAPLEFRKRYAKYLKKSAKQWDIVVVSRWKSASFVYWSAKSAQWTREFCVNEFHGAPPGTLFAQMSSAFVAADSTPPFLGTNGYKSTSAVEFNNDVAAYIEGAERNFIQQFWLHLCQRHKHAGCRNVDSRDCYRVLHKWEVIADFGGFFIMTGITTIASDGETCDAIPVPRHDTTEAH